MLPMAHRFKEEPLHSQILGFRSVLISAQLLTTARDTTVITEEPLPPNKPESFRRFYWLVKSSWLFKDYRGEQRDCDSKEMNVSVLKALLLTHASHVYKVPEASKEV